MQGKWNVGRELPFQQIGLKLAELELLELEPHVFPAVSERVEFHVRKRT